MRVPIKCNKDEKVANYRKDNKRYGRHGFDHYQCCTSWWDIYISHVSIHDFKLVSLYLWLQLISSCVEFKKKCYVSHVLEKKATPYQLILGAVLKWSREKSSDFNQAVNRILGMNSLTFTRCRHQSLLLQSCFCYFLMFRFLSEKSSCIYSFNDD